MDRQNELEHRVGRRTADGDERMDDGDERGVYIISVAAELVGVHPQTLRIYERKGLLSPSRTSGNTRRYSDRDIRRLRTIQRLTQEGVSLAGVQMILEMENRLDEMQRRMREVTAEAERARRRAIEEMESVRRENRAEIVPLSEVRRAVWRVRQVRPDPPRRGPIAVGPGAADPAERTTRGGKTKR
ncbi:MAG: heat shock protein transcriptional repressor HspR [Actinomycetota bacterium]